MTRPAPTSETASAPLLDTFLDRDALTTLLGLHRQRIKQLVISGEFPAPVRLTANGRKIGWLASEVRQWQEQAALHRRVVWKTGQPNPVKTKAARKVRK